MLWGVSGVRCISRFRKWFLWDRLVTPWQQQHSWGDTRATTCPTLLGTTCAQVPAPGDNRPSHNLSVAFPGSTGGPLAVFPLPTWPCPLTEVLHAVGVRVVQEEVAALDGAVHLEAEPQARILHQLRVDLVRDGLGRRGEALETRARGTEGQPGGQTDSPGATHLQFAVIQARQRHILHFHLQLLAEKSR